MPVNNKPYPSEKNQTKIHPLIKGSFANVPTAEMRLAPEVILLELYREIFFPKHFEGSKANYLNPMEKNDDKIYIYSKEERAVLYSLRGRRKKGGQSKAQTFYAPAYPALARNSWFREKSARVVINFFLGRSPGVGDREHEVCAPISQYLWHQGEKEQKKAEQEIFIEQFLNALIGQNSCRGENDFREKDILSVAIKEIIGEIDFKLARDNLFQKTSSKKVLRLKNDELSKTIFSDTLSICSLEKEIPRMQWLEIFMTFLRFVLPIWLLAQMRITSILYSWLLDALEGQSVNNFEIEGQLTNRSKNLLQPTLTPTREIYERIEVFVKHKEELNILLYNLEAVSGDILKGKTLEVTGEGATVINIEDLLTVAKNKSSKIKENERYRNKIAQLSFKEFFGREAENYSAWKDPRNKGQGKNIDEFFRVLYKDPIGDEDGGYLLESKGRGPTRGFRVFPGQLLLKTITYLALMDKKEGTTKKGGGKLVLGDIEKHFSKYGINFNYSADARPMLIQSLTQMGLLKGSPDAGDSVAVSNPY